MSTSAVFSPQIHTGRYDHVGRFIASLGDVRPLLRPEHLARRLTVLDQLDVLVGSLDSEDHEISSEWRIVERARTLKLQLEDANQKIYDAARSDIARCVSFSPIFRWLIEQAGYRNPQGSQPGLGFDMLDEVLSGILQLRGPAESGLLPSPEMAPYQPTPARHILELIAAAKLSDKDVLVDLGSGLGHVPLLVAILTGIRARGVELEPNYVAIALISAQNLNLKHVEFVAEDARTTDLSTGTVFYLFSPFSGSVLMDVLYRVSEQSRKRQVRICSLGPCTRILQEQVWLKPDTVCHAERIAVFRSQCSHHRRVIHRPG